MIKIITYGTYDLLHCGHIRLLERAKELGDYLIVGVTSDGFDRARGKINCKQSTLERVKAIEKTGLADKIIIEEYEGQKIDDIKKYNIDIFAIGSDWTGKFDYLNEYCKVVYLERTKGISSTKIRSEKNNIKISFIGDGNVLSKFYNESRYVNGLERKCILSNNYDFLNQKINDYVKVNNDDEIFKDVNAVYILATPNEHYSLLKKAINNDVNILCESPIVCSLKEFDEIYELVKKKNLVLMDSIKTAYAPAYHSLLLLVKSGAIGDVVSIDAVCTSLRSNNGKSIEDDEWTSIYAWGPLSLLPIFQILGTNYKTKKIITSYCDDLKKKDTFTNINFIYENAIASIKVGKGVKSEGVLTISGKKGCILVPAPWWKPDYFEIHFENLEENKRYFYQLDGEGIRNELVQFAENIENGTDYTYVDYVVSRKIVEVIEDFSNKIDVEEIKL